MTEAVRRKPYGTWTFAVGFLHRLFIPIAAVILLDELEKAHKVGVFECPYNHGVTHTHVMKDVSMILLQILDEGSITDSQGRKVDFKVQTSLYHSISL